MSVKCFAIVVGKVSAVAVIAEGGLRFIVEDNLGKAHIVNAYGALSEKCRTNLWVGDRVVIEGISDGEVKANVIHVVSKTLK